MSFRGLRPISFAIDSASRDSRQRRAASAHIRSRSARLAIKGPRQRQPQTQTRIAAGGKRRATRPHEDERLSGRKAPKRGSRHPLGAFVPRLRPGQPNLSRPRTVSSRRSSGITLSPCPFPGVFSMNADVGSKARKSRMWRREACRRVAVQLDRVKPVASTDSVLPAPCFPHRGTERSSRPIVSSTARERRTWRLRPAQMRSSPSQQICAFDRPSGGGFPSHEARRLAAERARRPLPSSGADPGQGRLPSSGTDSPMRTPSLRSAGFAAPSTTAAAQAHAGSTPPRRPRWPPLP